MVRDDAFPLKTHHMKPYPFKKFRDSKRIFNYRLSRARRVSENAFGILMNWFRVVDEKMYLSPKKSAILTESYIAIHNNLKTEADVC